MRNRKSLLSLAIVVLVLILGVGYAVVNNVTLTISGSASANADLNVYFDKSVDVTTTDEAPNAVIVASITDEKNATIEVTKLAHQESVSAVYTIKNGEKDISAILAAPVVSVKSKPAEGEGVDLSEYFNVTATLGKTTLAADESTTVTVTVTLAKTPLTAIDSTAAINITIDASAAAQN